MNEFRSCYSIGHVNDLFILIVDRDRGRSVTNDAVNIVPELDKVLNGLGNRTIFYKDSQGRFDEILHTGGLFDGFAPCSPGQQEKLAELLKRNEEVACRWP